MSALLEGDDLGLVTLVTFLGLAVTLALLLMLFMGQGAATDRRVNRRLEQLRKRGFGAAALDAGVANIKLGETTSSIPGLEQIARHLLPRRQLLADRLARTGGDMSLGAYALVCLTIGIVLAFVEIQFFRFPPAAALLAAIGAGAGLPHMFVSYMINRRSTAFIKLFPEAIELIVRGIKSGLPVAEEISVVGKEMADPVGIEFRRISDALRFGETLESALWATARRLGIPEFNFFVISLSVQRETGGNLAETLENLADILRRRRQMKLKIKALSSEARASAYIIGSLPFIMGGILCITAPVYISVLYNDPRGNIAAGVALFLQALGVFIMAKMVKFDI